jgi:hypothetical protein
MKRLDVQATVVGLTDGPTLEFWAMMADACRRDLGK